MPWRDQLSAPPGDRNRVQDPRFLRTYVNSPQLSRGMIQNIRPRANQSSIVESVHRFHFLTNPWEISTSYTVNTAVDLTDPANHSGTLAGIPPMREGLISISFSMLLDRTYEIWSGSLPEGVLHDMAQLERVLGVPDVLGGYVVNRGLTADAARAARGQAASGEWRETVPRALNQFPGVLVKRPVRFRFGGVRAYSFEGYVTDLSITMMKFNAEMVPTRAGINISATTWGDPETAPLTDTPRLTPEGLGGPLSGNQGSPSVSTSPSTSGGYGGQGGVFE